MSDSKERFMVVTMTYREDFLVRKAFADLIFQFIRSGEIAL